MLVGYTASGLNDAKPTPVNAAMPGVEVLAEATDLKVPFKRCGVTAEFQTTVGSQDYMRALCGLSEAALVRTLEAFL